MTTQPIAQLDPRFSSPDAESVPWAAVVQVLEESEIFWLSTVRADGRPHVVPLPAIWLGGALHFCTGTDEQKTRNLERNPKCVLTTGCNRFREGLDVVVEGLAAPVLDQQRLTRLAALWLAKLDWRFDVVEGGFRDPGVAETDAADSLAIVFSVQPSKVLAFGKGEPYSQTRYRFA